MTAWEERSQGLHQFHNNRPAARMQGRQSSVARGPQSLSRLHCKDAFPLFYHLLPSSAQKCSGLVARLQRGQSQVHELLRDFAELVGIKHKTSIILTAYSLEAEP